MWFSYPLHCLHMIAARFSVSHVLHRTAMKLTILIASWTLKFLRTIYDSICLVYWWFWLTSINFSLLPFHRSSFHWSHMPPTAFHSILFPLLFSFTPYQTQRLLWKFRLTLLTVHQRSLKFRRSIITSAFNIETWQKSKESYKRMILSVSPFPGFEVANVCFALTFVWNSSISVPKIWEENLLYAFTSINFSRTKSNALHEFFTQ